MAYAFVGLAVFGLYRVLDLNRLHRAGPGRRDPASGRNLNVFLLFLRLFGESS
jgi:hypothetical protein